MTKIMYAHQANQLAEQTIAAFCQTLRLGRVDQVRIKATQWLTWTGRWDSGPAWSITDLDALRRTRDAFVAEGIKFLPWGCPMGLDAAGHTAVDAAGVEAEARRFADIANACGAIDLDIEPYGEFWPALVEGDYRAVTPFFRRLRELAPDARIVVDLPYRDAHWAGDENERMSPVLELASPFVDAFYLQSYFGVDQARDAERRARQHTDRPVYHIADTEHLPEMVDWLAAEGAAEVAVWYAPRMTRALYAVLAEHTFGADDGGPPAPRPSTDYVYPFDEDTHYAHGHWDGALAVDVFGAKGSRIVACTAGWATVADYPLGGHTVTLKGDDGRHYYHAHLLEGSGSGGRKAAGDPIGRIGNTGNAADRPPHCHWAVGSAAYGIDNSGAGDIAPWALLDEWRAAAAPSPEGAGDHEGRIAALEAEVARLSEALALERSWGSAILAHVIRPSYQLLDKALSARRLDRAKVGWVRELLGQHGGE